MVVARAGECQHWLFADKEFGGVCGLLLHMAVCLANCFSRRSLKTLK